MEKKEIVIFIAAIAFLSIIILADFTGITSFAIFRITAKAFIQQENSNFEPFSTIITLAMIIILIYFLKKYST